MLSFIIVCIFCLGISVAGIMLCHQWINTYNSGFYKNCLYYLIAFYTFAIYTIWGQVIVRTILTSLSLKTETIEAVSNIFPILGVPFLFVSWIMLIYLVYSIFDMPVKPIWVAVHVFVFAGVLAGPWILDAFFSDLDLLKGEGAMFVGMGILLFFEFIYIVLIVIVYFINEHKAKLTSQLLFKKFILILAFGYLLRVGCIAVSVEISWIIPLAILFFFASNFLPIVYLYFNTDQMFDPVMVETSDETKLELLFDKFKITRREREIVNLICTGKTNQQIADDLFISLQTVKDHTHRIYTKIGIRSRMQLVQMVS